MDRSGVCARDVTLSCATYGWQKLADADSQSVEANTGHNNANGHLCSSFRFLAEQQEVVVGPIVGKFHDKLSYATSSFSITNYRTV